MPRQQRAVSPRRRLHCVLRCGRSVHHRRRKPQARLELDEAPPPMTNTAFDDGVERSYEVLLDKTSRSPVARARPAHPVPRQIAASRYVGCMAAVATSPIVGVTMTSESNRDHTTGPLQGAQTWACPNRECGGTTVSPSRLPKIGRTQPDMSLNSRSCTCLPLRPTVSPTSSSPTPS